MDFIDKNGNYSKMTEFKNGEFLYQDGIVNPDIFEKEDVKILWILKETNGKFNPISWWGKEEYNSQKINPFDRNKKVKGTKRATWIPVARVCYNILKGTDSTDDLALAECLKHIAIINLKKTPGTSKSGENFNEYVQKVQNQEVILEQIKRIKPNVIICGSTLKYLPNKKLGYRSGKQEKLSKFSENQKYMKKNSCFMFSNIIFINPYHPSYVMDKDEYVKIIIDAFNEWNKARKNNQSLSEFIF